MQNEMLAVEEAMNIEAGAVKTETVDVESELFEIEQNRGPTAKYANADKTVVNRSKEGHIVEDWRNDPEMQDIKVKLEGDINCEDLKTEFEVMIKHENDDSNDADGEIALNRIKKEQLDNNWKNELEELDTAVKLEENVNCEDLKIKAEELIIKEEHDDLNNASGEKAVNRSLKILNGQNQHLKTADKLTCTQCNTAFKRKPTLDDHIVRMHPHLIASVSRKIYECTHCTYKTIMKHHLTRHMSQHYKTADSHKLRCVQCDAAFTSKQTRDEHIVRKHPNSVASVSSKIHQCAYCTYQTVIKSQFARHMLKHPETADSYELSTCGHCNAIYKRKISLDNHIVKQHPEYMASISRKIYECTQCSYKTVIKANLDQHMLKHPETADSYKFSTCVHCNASFQGKQALDDHMVRKHPDSIGSISIKIYECMHCAYKTSKRSSFARHVLIHL